MYCIVKLQEPQGTLESAIRARVLVRDLANVTYKTLPTLTLALKARHLHVGGSALCRIKIGLPEQAREYLPLV